MCTGCLGVLDCLWWVSCIGWIVLHWFSSNKGCRVTKLHSDSQGSFRPIFKLCTLLLSLSDCCISAHLCVRFYYLCVCQWCAPAVYLPLSKWCPNVRANFSVEFSPPDTRGESSRRSRSRESASGVNQLDLSLLWLLIIEMINRQAYARVTWPETQAYSAWVRATAGGCGDPRGERVSDGDVGSANAEAGGGIKGSLDRPKKRLNL